MQIRSAFMFSAPDNSVRATSSAAIQLDHFGADTVAMQIEGDIRAGFSVVRTLVAIGVDNDHIDANGVA